MYRNILFCYLSCLLFLSAGKRWFPFWRMERKNCKYKVTSPTAKYISIYDLRFIVAVEVCALVFANRSCNFEEKYGHFKQTLHPSCWFAFKYVLHHLHKSWATFLSKRPEKCARKWIIVIVMVIQKLEGSKSDFKSVTIWKFEVVLYLNSGSKKSPWLKTTLKLSDRCRWFTDVF